MSTQPISTTIPKKKGSRKGKKSWKKNIDITEVENTLEDIRAEERAFGGKIQERPDEQLFTLDIDGDAQVKKKLKHRKLRVDEILEQRSSVPAVGSKTTSLKEQAKLSGLTKAQLVSLHKRKLEGDSKRPKKKPAKRAAYDIWETEDIDPIDAKDEKGFLQSQKVVKKKAPDTYTMKPAGIPAVKIAHPGASYNPKEEDHKELINIAGQVEMDKISKNQTLVHISAHASVEDQEEETPKEEEEEESAEASASEDESNAVLSVKKTKTQRNKEARKLAQKREEEKQKKNKQLSKEIARVHELEKQVQAELEEREKKQKEKELLAQEQALKPKKKIGKHLIKLPSIEVKLQDELPDSLRKLKPEGNLFKDRFASLQERNLVEARIPVSARRRYRLKEYEKRSYKNFK
ncbi:tumor suppressor protein Gltscr2 [Basidiobolus meristosporus CBS 931.73]|uniref:Ribosome biogenesis protein NOP53 n=1 Tax=Basidiobolus meristosporus CBS 931.73 TaxID=1314790 RepID=A0A1Y1YU79_9FUNG|nr:tumor suppressor protein Gltscr2 [Basidiobolus meristosporus CBS 931.73]|eukprot:ORY01561.1 tumor suppressor protein Gltscr2 [Basidiobolus meristosporus CBS 931.73]